MPIRPIVRLGHPALRTPARAVEDVDSKETQRLIDDMVETMLEADGVGLAAPQLGIESQLFVYAAIGEDGHHDGELGPENVRVLINPALEPEAGELVYEWEGCLSIPELRGLVPRHPAVRVHALDRHGKSLNFRSAGYEGRIIQHEYDHLNGIVFLDRMRDLRSLAYHEEWEEFLTEDDGNEPSVG